MISIKWTSKSNSKVKHIWIVYKNNQNAIQNHLEYIFDKYSTCIGDCQDMYWQACLNKFNQYPLVGYKKWQPCQLWSTHNLVVQHFNNYVSLHQPHQSKQQEGPASSLRWQKTDENLIVMCLPNNFPVSYPNHHQSYHYQSLLLIKFVVRHPHPYAPRFLRKVSIH